MENGKWKMDRKKARRAIPHINHLPFTMCHSPRRWRAFTLLELLVVLGIITLLIAITVPLIRKVRVASQGAATQAQLTTLANAIQQYYSDFHAYPGPLPNGQLGEKYQTTPPSGDQQIYDPSTPPNLLLLSIYDGTTNSVFPMSTVSGDSQLLHITGAENLVLGLLGGLQLRGNAAPYYFEYYPKIIFPDGVTPNAAGALSLNANHPKRTPAYLQVRSGDISHPNSAMSAGQFTDTAGRAATDSIIPEFIDQFSDQMPILYLRANVGGTAIASIAGHNDAGAALQDTATLQPVVAQYDLAQILDYTKSTIGTIANKPNLAQHCLQGLGADKPMTDTIQDTRSLTAINPKNGLAYFKDPNNPGTVNVPDSTANPPTRGNARQKDGYLLISAGPDGIYGTSDDLIYPGSLQP